MGQKITVKKKRYWRKKGASRAINPTAKKGLLERIKSFFGKS